LWASGEVRTPNPLLVVAMVDSRFPSAGAPPPAWLSRAGLHACTLIGIISLSLGKIEDILRTSLGEIFKNGTSKCTTWNMWVKTWPIGK